MIFHDVLHGIIEIKEECYKELIGDLLDCTEIQRLRNMRQMNFDVSLIQELGRSRRLPHSIGVTHIAIKLAQNGQLSISRTKELIAAAMLHDAAIPPYGHLVETELNQHSQNGFKHAQVIRDLITGNLKNKNRFSEILRGRTPEIHDILSKHKISHNAVFELISPEKKSKSPVASDIDIDNLDNVHRMAVMLGWREAYDNLNEIIEKSSISENGSLVIPRECSINIKNWLSYRQRIYTLIIAHPECIPQNALQSDLVRQAVTDQIITEENWYITEPEFEEKLRASESTKEMAWQLITGCQYHLIDYLWAKDITPKNKLNNNTIYDLMLNTARFYGKDYSIFIWYEKGLISREVCWIDENNRKFCEGKSTHSCMVALVKKTIGGKFKEDQKKKWRQAVWVEISKLVDDDKFTVEYPSDYTGDYYNKGKTIEKLL